MRSYSLVWQINLSVFLTISLTCILSHFSHIFTITHSFSQVYHISLGNSRNHLSSVFHCASLHLDKQKWIITLFRCFYWLYPVTRWHLTVSYPPFIIVISGKYVLNKADSWCETSRCWTGLSFSCFEKKNVNCTNCKLLFEWELNGKLQ